MPRQATTASPDAGVACAAVEESIPFGEFDVIPPDHSTESPAEERKEGNVNGSGRRQKEDACRERLLEEAVSRWKASTHQYHIESLIREQNTNSTRHSSSQTAEEGIMSDFAPPRGLLHRKLSSPPPRGAVTTTKGAHGVAAGPHLYPKHYDYQIYSSWGPSHPAVTASDNSSYSSYPTQYLGAFGGYCYPPLAATAAAALPPPDAAPPYVSHYAYPQPSSLAGQQVHDTSCWMLHQAVNSSITSPCVGSYNYEESAAQYPHPSIPEIYSPSPAKDAKTVPAVNKQRISRDGPEVGNAGLITAASEISDPPIEMNSFVLNVKRDKSSIVNVQPVKRYMKPRSGNPKAVAQYERKNAMSRRRLGQIQHEVAEIEAKPEHTRTEKEKERLKDYHESKSLKNRRSRERAIEQKRAIELILSKSEDERTMDEKFFLDELIQRKRRKNEGDRLRRLRLKELGLLDKKNLPLEQKPRISARGPLPASLVAAARTHAVTPSTLPDTPPAEDKSRQEVQYTPMTQAHFSANGYVPTYPYPQPPG